MILINGAHRKITFQTLEVTPPRLKDEFTHFAPMWHTQVRAQQTKQRPKLRALDDVH